MKKLSKLFFIFVLTVLLASLAFGCSLFGDNGSPVGISSIEKTDTEGLVDTYTITMTDGSTSTFTVTNGKNGSSSTSTNSSELFLFTLLPGGTYSVQARYFNMPQKFTVPQSYQGKSVTVIADYFSCEQSNNRSTDEIVLPNTITTIGDWAFRLYITLSKINIPEGVSTIGAYAFRGCEKLTSITLPNSLTEIGENAFFGTGLTSITLPNKLKTIESGIFSGCENLTSIVIPKSVTYIDHLGSCYTIKSITYLGTKAQWNAIDKNEIWDEYFSGGYTVHCTDGDITG